MTPEQSMDQAAQVLSTLLLIGITSFGFWLWMLINCLVRPAWSFPGGESNGTRVVWTLVLIFVPLIGVLAYFFIVYLPGFRRKRW